MNIITNSSALEKACCELAQFSFCTVDTEFLREKTFWPDLCLVQMASPEEAFIVDVLAPEISLAPFFDLMANQSVIKVFHAARQDIEIFHHLSGQIPNPIFDTQIAAMVCGYGDSISYDQLVTRITGKHIDKSLRFTDWSVRPLSEKQLNYALADVTHLRDVYAELNEKLLSEGRCQWVLEELSILERPETYEVDPGEAWKRLKMRAKKPRELMIMQKVAEWRENLARTHNVPRGRVLKDDAIYDISARPPSNLKQLGNLRSINHSFDKNKYADSLLEVVNAAASTPKEALPALPKTRRSPEGCSAITDLLKVLLKIVSEKHGVAAKIIATVDDLEKIAANDNANVPALQGWRRELFGDLALDLKQGKLALGYQGREIKLMHL